MRRDEAELEAHAEALRERGFAVTELYDRLATRERIVLKGARGILVMRRIENAILVVLLSRGLSPEDVRLSMDGTIARIERTPRTKNGQAHQSTTGVASTNSAH